MNQDLTSGPIGRKLIMFSIPMILGNLLQQVYNIADTLIVGKVLGTEALAAVGAAYAFMTFLTSIIIGLCMGCGALFSMYYGGKKMKRLKQSIAMSFAVIAVIMAVLTSASVCWLDQIIRLLQVPGEIRGILRDYLSVILFGMLFTFLYNYFAFLLRAIGNSVVPLISLAAASVCNIVLDLLFVIGFQWGPKGAAFATVIAQGISAAGVLLYTLVREKQLRIHWTDFCTDWGLLKEIGQYSVFTCIQQSVMNFGILMVQGLVNQFGTAVMAAFAAAVKIDSFAYMPAQEFGNAYSIFISQNYGAGERKRIQKGTKTALKISMTFCAVISVLVWILAKPFMWIFIDPSETETVKIGVEYLRIEGAFYCGIGCLFLLYGLYRAIAKPFMSVVLTVISLGTRVGLAYALAPITWIGVWGIWWAIPIGWGLADAVGILYYRNMRKKME